MMIVRRNAVTQVVGFMSMENGLILAATGARGMPLVVEVSVAFSVLISLFVFAVFVFRIRDASTPSTSRRSTACAGIADDQCLSAVVWYPIRLGAHLVAIRDTAWGPSSTWGLRPRLCRRLVAVVGGERRRLRHRRRVQHRLHLINTLVGFTTGAVQRLLIGHEIETGRLSPSFVRFYHAMFQAMMGSMNLALIANNIGVMWVGLRARDPDHVVMVGLYRMPQAIEAAWKYFILASVGISRPSSAPS